MLLLPIEVLTLQSVCRLTQMPSYETNRYAMSLTVNIVTLTPSRRAVRRKYLHAERLSDNIARNSGLANLPNVHDN